MLHFMDIELSGPRNLVKPSAESKDQLSLFMNVRTDRQTSDTSYLHCILECKFRCGQLLRETLCKSQSIINIKLQLILMLINCGLSGQRNFKEWPIFKNLKKHTRRVFKYKYELFVHRRLDEQPQTSFERVVMKLSERWRLCMEVQREYVQQKGLLF
jgi:hypothetical protein